MKQLGFLIMLISTLSVSCRKSRVCECTYSDGTGSYTETYSYTNKSDAKELCANEEISGLTTCELQ